MWDETFPPEQAGGCQSHDVIFRNQDEIVLVVEDDISAMTCYGAWLTAKAAEALNAAGVEYFDSIDGNVADWYFC